MANRARYDGLTKAFVGTGSRDTIMPMPITKSLPDLKLANGSPFGPFDPDKPYWPETVSQAGQDKTKYRKSITTLKYSEMVGVSDHLKAEGTHRRSIKR